jgi:hypothetical protein
VFESKTGRHASPVLLYTSCTLVKQPILVRDLRFSRRCGHVVVFWVLTARSSETFLYCDITTWCHNPEKNRNSQHKLIHLQINFYVSYHLNRLGPTKPPIQWIPVALSLGVKWPGREADHSLPSSAKVKECVELYLHYPHTPSLRGDQLKESTRTTLTLLLPSQN